MFRVRNFFFNVHIKSRSSEYISDIFVRFGVIGNNKKLGLFALRNPKCSTNSYLDGSFDVVHHLDRASLLCWWCWSSSSRESFSREFSTCRINLRFLPLSSILFSSFQFSIWHKNRPRPLACLLPYSPFAKDVRFMWSGRTRRSIQKCHHTHHYLAPL